MHYELIFDVGKAGYRYWWVPLLGLIVLAICIAQIAYLRTRLTKGFLLARLRRWMLYFIACFASVWVPFAFVNTLQDYWALHEALRTGRYEIVEGTVTDFVPMPTEGHAEEHFVVNGHYYEYSDHRITAGFNNSMAYGGPIRDRLRVRIADVGGKIARLEIAR